VSGLLGCATPLSAPTSDKAAPAAPAAAVDVDALIMRDSLTSEEVELISVTYAELDGAAPQELLIHTRRRSPDRLMPHDVLWLYDVSRAGDPQPIPVAPLREWGAARVHGGLSWGSDDGRAARIEDVDGDGRAEIVLVPGLLNGAPMLDVLAWGRDAGGEGVIDKLWRDPGGVDAAAVDVDGDGRRELVVINAASKLSGGEPRVAALRPDSAGMWREVEAAPEVMLPAVLDALVIERSSVSEGLPHVVALMRAAKLKARDVARLQRALEARVEALRVERGERGRVQGELEWLADAMAWAGSERAYDVLLPYVRGPATLKVAGPLLALDAQTKQTRGQEALLAELDALLAGEVEEDVDEGYDARMRRFEGLLAALDRYGVAGVVERLGAALDAGVLTGADNKMAVEALWRVGAPKAAALWGEGVDDERLSSLLLWTWALIGAPDAARREVLPTWLGMFDAGLLRGWLARPGLYVVAAKIALHKGDAGLREEVWRRLDAKKRDWEREAIFREAERLGVALPADKLVSSWLRGSSISARRALWSWAFKVGDAAQLKKMLASGATSDELERMPPALYATGAACDVAPRARPGCVTTRGKMAGELALLHKIAAAALGSSEVGEVQAAIEVMGRLRHEPTRQRLLALADDPGVSVQVRHAAQDALFTSGQVEVSEYLKMLEQREPERSTFYHVRYRLDVEGAGQVVAWLLAQDAAVVDAAGVSALEALNVAAPGVCAAEVGRLGALVDDERLSCEVRPKAAAVLARCDASWLAQLASEARASACEGRFVMMLSSVGDGGAAHLKELERLAEDPRSRVIREEAHYGARQIKARGARP
jgi:hypothetical protein